MLTILAAAPLSISVLAQGEPVQVEVLSADGGVIWQRRATNGSTVQTVCPSGAWALRAERASADGGIERETRLISSSGVLACEATVMEGEAALWFLITRHVVPPTDIAVDVLVDGGAVVLALTNRSSAPLELASIGVDEPGDEDDVCSPFESLPPGDRRELPLTRFVCPAQLQPGSHLANVRLKSELGVETLVFDLRVPFRVETPVAALLPDDVLDELTAITGGRRSILFGRRHEISCVCEGDVVGRESARIVRTSIGLCARTAHSGCAPIRRPPPLTPGHVGDFPNFPPYYPHPDQWSR